MAVRVAGTRRSNGDLRLHRIDKCLGGRGSTPVMGHLEEIDAREAGGEQLRVDPVLDVAHQEEPAGPDRAYDDHRDVVDAGAPVGRLGRDAATQRPEHVHRDLVHAHSITRGNAHPLRSPPVGQFAQPCLIPGSRPGHAWFEHAIDVIPGEQQREPRDMVFVRVRQDDRIDPPIPRRDASIECDEETIRVRPAVDQQAAAP
jgi:hypothetical protein